MSLQLDARQRAMLQEMGITLWQPAPKPAAAPVAQTRPAPAVPRAAAASDTAVMDAPVIERDSAPQARQQPRPAVQRPAVPVAAPFAAPSARMDEPTSAATASLRAPQPLYPQADAAKTPKELGSGWLVVFETATPDEPFGGDSGKLLDNMLRAMRLHLHPRTFACVLERSAPGQDINTAALNADLAQTLAELQPAMVLILGLGAARATLGNREPLGRLRAAQHQLANGTPAIVSYDPAYLLRAPDAKASAWADLCRALAVVRKAADT